VPLSPFGRKSPVTLLGRKRKDVLVVPSPAKAEREKKEGEEDAISFFYT